MVNFSTKNNSDSSRAITSAWWASTVWSGFSESFLISHRSKWWSSPTDPKRWSRTACHATSSTGPSWYYISNKSYHNINEYLTAVIKKKRTQHLIQLNESPPTHTFLANREKLHSMNTRAERRIMISLVEQSTLTPRRIPRYHVCNLSLISCSFSINIYGVWITNHFSYYMSEIIEHSSFLIELTTALESSHAKYLVKKEGSFPLVTM